LLFSSGELLFIRWDSLQPPRLVLCVRGSNKRERTHEWHALTSSCTLPFGSPRAPPRGAFERPRLVAARLLCQAPLIVTVLTPLQASAAAAPIS
jgi:hypothetical protein